MTENKSIKPCPFCGAKPLFKRTSFGSSQNDFRTTYYLECPDCHIYFSGESIFEVVDGDPVIKKNGYQECIDKWNRRENNHV